MARTRRPTSRSKSPSARAATRSTSTERSTRSPPGRRRRSRSPSTSSRPRARTCPSRSTSPQSRARRRPTTTSRPTRPYSRSERPLPCGSVDDLTTTQGIVALAAAGGALLALVWALVLSVKLRRLRGAQRAVLGDGGQRDLVSHASELETAFVQLRDWVEETAAGLDRRAGGAEQRMDSCIAYRALVRSDAYGEMPGRQSSTLALLDAHRTGVVVSSILHREQARVYVKHIHQGESELELSPEEAEAIELAMAGTAGAHAEA